MIVKETIEAHRNRPNFVGGGGGVVLLCCVLSYWRLVSNLTIVAKILYGTCYISQFCIFKKYIYFVLYISFF